MKNSMAFKHLNDLNFEMKKKIEKKVKQILKKLRQILGSCQ
jgi:hypothetical protein